MQNAPGMSRLQSTRDLQGSFDRLLCRHWPPQWFSLYILQHQIICADVVDLTDMRMIKRRDGTSFLLKARAMLALQPLNRDDAVKPRVARFPHLAHPARAN